MSEQVKNKKESESVYPNTNMGAAKGLSKLEYVSIQLLASSVAAGSDAALVGPKRAIELAKELLSELAKEG